MDKVWVASLVPNLQPEQLEVFDNESDAYNFALEMHTAGSGEYKVLETPVNSRDDKIKGEPHWIDFTSLNAQCIECLLEDFSTVAGQPVDERACVEFIEKHKDELQEKSNHIVNEYLKKAISDYVNNERIVLG